MANPYSAAGLASGIASGVQQFQQARSNEQTMQNSRRQLQLQEAREQRLGATFDLQKQQQELALQQLQMQLQQTQKQAAKQDAVNAHLAASRSGNPEYLNMAIQNSPFFQEMAQKQGIVGYSSLDDLSPEMQKKLGYDPETMSSIKNFMFVQEKADGTKLLYRTDGGLLMMGGFDLLDKEQKSALEQYKAQIDAREAEATTAQKESEVATQSRERELASMLATLDPTSDEFQSAKTELLGLQGKLTETKVGEVADTQIGDYLNNNYENFMSALTNAGYNTKIQIGDKEYSAKQIAEVAQGKNKISVQEEGMLNGYSSAKKSMIKLHKILQSKDFDRDFMERIKGGLASVIDIDWVKASPETKEKILAKFEFDSQLQTAIAEYIKAMSGAAVTDQERQGFTNTILTNVWSNKDAALASMTGFVKQLDRTLNNRVEDLKTNYPRTYLDKKRLVGLPEEFKDSSGKVDAQLKAAKSAYPDKNIEIRDGKLAIIDDSGNVTAYLRAKGQ